MLRRDRPRTLRKASQNTEPALYVGANLSSSIHEFSVPVAGKKKKKEKKNLRNELSVTFSQARMGDKGFSS